MDEEVKNSDTKKVLQTEQQKIAVLHKILKYVRANELKKDHLIGNQ